MPTILRIGRYRFYFFSNEGQEPPHIHVKAGSDEAKFWLEPLRLAANYGFQARELNKIASIVEDHQEEFQEAWYAYFEQERYPEAPGFCAQQCFGQESRV